MSRSPFGRSLFRHLPWAGFAGLVLGLLALAGTAFAATGWTVATVPASDPGTNAILQGGSVLSGTDAWAVGAEFGPAGSAPPPGIAYHWNGTAWSRVATPSVPNVTSDSLTAVSASSTTDAWAVGLDHPVGSGYHGGAPLFEHWNGTAWSLVSGPTSGPTVGGLVGVADFGPGNAIAAGNAGVLVQWNGTAWNVVNTPHPNPSDTVGDHLTSLSADGPNDIWAVGTFAAQSTDNSSIYALHYNGTSWTVTSLPQPAAGAILLGVSAVSAVSPSNVWVAGSANGGAYVEHYNGTAWAEVPLPGGLFDPSLSAVVARSASDVWVFGQGLASATSTQTVHLLLHWDGTSWSSSPSPTGSGYSFIYAAVTGPGAPFWGLGVNSGNQPLIISHS